MFEGELCSTADEREVLSSVLPSSALSCPEPLRSLPCLEKKKNHLSARLGAQICYTEALMIVELLVEVHVPVSGGREGRRRQ